MNEAVKITMDVLTKLKNVSILNNIEQMSLKTKEEIEKYINIDGTIEIDSIEKDWFESIDADIFLSHSHSDIEEVNKLASHIQNETGLKVFVDSNVWGHADDLMRLLNNKYSIHPDKEDTYIYENAMKTASIVHSVLSIALNKMMDKSEFVFFLESSNSLKLDSISKQEKTHSPWIYAELSMVQTLRKKRKSIRVLENLDYQKQIKPSFSIDTSRFISLSREIFEQWIKSCKGNRNFITSNNNRREESIESLYKLIKKTERK